MANALSRFLGGSWLRQGAWTIADQALFAGANFVVNVLLARWLAPEAFGAFTVAFVVFLLAGTVHGGMLIEPMLVFGSGRFEAQRRSYLRELLRLHGQYTLVAGAVLLMVAAGCWSVGAMGFAALFLALGLAQGAILALWLMRRACFLVARPDWAAGVGALYLVLLIGGAAALNYWGMLTGATALGLMGGASLISAALLAVPLGVIGAPTVPGLAAEIWEQHVEYGRWSASTGVLEWVQLAIPFLVLPLFVGLAGSGTLRALFNLVMPAVQGFGALATLCLPIFVRARAAGTFEGTLRTLGAGLVGLGALYGALLLAFGGPVADWLYEGAYPATTGMLLCLAAIPVVVAASNVLTTTVRSAERPEAVFRARAGSVAVSGTVVVGLSAAFGVVGALLGGVIGLLTEVGLLARPAAGVRAEAAAEAAGPSPPEAPRPEAPALDVRRLAPSGDGAPHTETPEASWT